VVSALDVKLFRDLGRLWAQGLAIALVAAAGVMTLLLGVGTLRALSETQQAYYERYRFADVFASATHIPAELIGRIADVEGVAVAEGRIEQRIILDIEGMSEPANGLVLSIPDTGEPRLNSLHLLEGRMPEQGRADEVVVSGAFATAQGLHPGAKLSAIMDGDARQLLVTGIVLSPEFVYSVGPGDMMPDDRRFGVIWMSHSSAAASFGTGGGFNAVSIRLMRGADERSVIAAIDQLLRPNGGSGAYGRDQQFSHAFLSSELTQLEAMSYMLPPIFLGVAAFLVNMTLGRLVTLEREQIGLFKAIGYGSASIAWHYIKLALLIGAIGVVLGWGFGAWLGRLLAGVYAEFYKFPFLLFDERPDVFAISGLAALLAAALGSLQAVVSTVRLPPAVAMSPPVPPVYSRSLLDRVGLVGLLPKGMAMAVRNLLRRPLRSALTTLGVVLATGLLVAGLFAEDSIDFMIDATFFQAERQQASLLLARPVGSGGVESMRRLPGVIAAEPARTVAVVLRNGPHSKRSALVGKAARTDLSRVVDLQMRPVVIPEHGLVLSEMMASLLNVRVGDRLDVELTDGSDRIVRETVSQIVQQFVGLGAYMEIGALNRLLGEAPKADSVSLMVDAAYWDELFEAVKNIPLVGGMTLERRSVERFRATIGENIGVSRLVYAVLASLIVFGVVYNAMRIQLSERARELASLRVLGFTLGEVSIILLGELAILVVLSIPLGWMVGYALALAVSQGFQSELFRIPLIIDRSTYATAGLIVLGAALLSAYFVQRRVASLDMIAVLKTRD
jgi:putative ABC transport system permease protein